ncbi:MAG: dihydroneopterin aldolase [Prevotella sp.]|uniref:dihydroneopterin aldolase n=1 Tax=Prevotella sp. TaxID=59823 RepID=UPI002A2DD3A9|nr:dihydroneopterin aldolase [Prevotella sp.]MDD7317846.1 dihydroneopterin aldolase [Prevotellaceae bacterium]MDY4020761.1 dihydroneopterin aldolase [Prevotella sp.]
MRLKESWIELDTLRFNACHGVLPQERLTGGEFTVSLKVKYDISRAVLSDAVEDTISYAEIFKIVNREMLKPSCLLEHLAGRIGESLFNEIEGIGELQIKVSKLNPPMGAQCNGATVSLYLINDKTL